jgi:hypothetical protein
MKYLLYNAMLFFRPLFFFASKLLGGLFFLGGLGLIYYYQTTAMRLLGGGLCISPFLLFMFRDLYDNLIFRLKPDNIRLFLNKY